MVSELCFGAMTFVGESGWKHVGDLGQKEADAFVGIAMDAGVNFFDTADIYSMGESERILGKALGARRQHAVVATKVGFRVGPGPEDDGLSHRRIIDGCEASLRRLGTDYIDLYQVHSYDPLVALEETLEALNNLVCEGKVRYIGCSNFYAWQLMKALAVSDRKGWAKFISLQAWYSLVARDLEYELVPLCLDQGLGVLPWSPLAGGFLTGKYRRGNPWPRGTRLASSQDHFPFEEEKGYCIVDELERIARSHNGTVAQTALNYLLCKPSVASVVFGARTREQLEENLRSAAWAMSPDEVSRLDQLSTPPEMYPRWYFKIFRKDRMEQTREGSHE